MELKNFVKATLEQIVLGVSEAQAMLAEHGASANPTNAGFTKDGQWNQYDHAMPQDVIFDVALTSTDKSGTSEGIGVFLGSISLGKRNDSGTEAVAVTKVKFTVPLVLPPGNQLMKR